MVEQHLGGRGFSEPSVGLLVPDSRIVTEEDLTRIFGIDCRKAVQDILVGLQLLAEGDELEFLNPPMVHVYPQEDGSAITSGAQYFVEDMMVGNHAVMASYMSPGEKSTIHLHRFPITEEYHVVAGRSSLKLGEDVIELDEQNSFVRIPQDVEHQLSTNSHPAFTLIIMRSAALVPRERWHELVGSGATLSHQT